MKMRNKALLIIVLLLAYLSFWGMGTFSKVHLPGDIIDSLEIEIYGINTYGVLYPDIVIRFNKCNGECTFISKVEMESDSFDEEILKIDFLRTREIAEQINSLFISDSEPIYSSYERLNRNDNREVDYVPLDWLFIRFYRHNYFLLGCKRKKGERSVIVGNVTACEEQNLYDKEKVLYSDSFKKFMDNIYEIMDGIVPAQSEVDNNKEEINTDDLKSIVDSLDSTEFQFDA